MSVILTNGATSVIMRDSDFQVLQVPPWKTPSRIIENSVGLPHVHALSGGRETRLLTCLVDLELSDRAATAQGMTSLMNFFEGTDHTGVDGDINTFMLTDADGVSYQVRFADNLAGGLREGPKNQFSGTIQLINEYTLPTDEGSLQAWYAAYDMDDNGGNLSAWTDSDDVGAGSQVWNDLADNFNGTQATVGSRPLWRNTSVTINNRPVVSFDGTDDNLEADGHQGPWGGGGALQAFSFYIVFQPDAFDATGDVAFSFGRASGASDRIIHVEAIGIGGGLDENFNFEVDDGASTDSSVTNMTTTAVPHIISGIYNPTGTAYSMWVNGNQEITADTITIGNMDLDVTRIGALEQAGTVQKYFNGQIGEIVLFYTTHNDMQRRRQEYRLSDMWGISLTG